MTIDLDDELRSIASSAPDNGYVILTPVYLVDAGCGKTASRRAITAAVAADDSDGCTEYSHRRQPHRGCRVRIPTNILVGWDINGNVPTNIWGGNVVEYELLIASVKRIATLSFKKLIINGSISHFSGVGTVVQAVQWAPELLGPPSSGATEKF